MVDGNTFIVVTPSISRVGSLTIFSQACSACPTAFFWTAVHTEVGRNILHLYKLFSEHWPRSLTTHIGLIICYVVKQTKRATPRIFDAQTLEAESPVIKMDRQKLMTLKVQELQFTSFSNNSQREVRSINKPRQVRMNRTGWQVIAVIRLSLFRSSISNTDKPAMCIGSRMPKEMEFMQVNLTKEEEIFFFCEQNKMATHT